MLILLNLLNPIVGADEDPERPSRIYPPEDKPTEVVEQKQRSGVSIDPNAVYGDLFQSRPGAPEYSSEYEQNLRNRAKAGKIGDLLKILGDVYGVAKGAPVERRKISSTEPYLQQIDAARQKYKDDLEQYEKEDFERQLRILGGMGVQQQRGDAAKESARRFDIEQGMKERKMTADQQYREHLTKKGLQDTILNREKFNEQVRQAGIKATQAQERLGIYKDQAKTAKIKAEQSTKKPFMQARVGGEDIDLSEGQYRDYLQKALAAAGEGEGSIKDILAAVGHQPTEEYKQVVQSYLERTSLSSDPAENIPVSTGGLY